MADNLRKFTTQEVLNKVYTDSSGITIGLNSQSSKETLNAVLDSSNNRLQVAMAGGTISGDVTISGDLTVSGSGGMAFSEVLTGDMKITTSSSATALYIESSDSGASLIQFTNSTTGTTANDGLKIGLGDDEVGLFRMQEAKDMVFQTDSTTRMTIDSSGRVVIGHTANVALGTTDPALQVLGTSEDASQISIGRFSADDTAPKINLIKGRGGIGANTIVTDNDNLGTINFRGADGSDLDTIGASIEARVNGTPGANDLPAELLFSTTADGAATPTTRMIITSAGKVGIGTGVTPTMNYQSTHIKVSTSGSDSILGIDNAGSGTTSITMIRSAGVHTWTHGVNTSGNYVIANQHNVGGAIRMVLDANSRISLSNNDNNTSNTVFGKNAFNASSNNGSDFNVVIGEDAMATGSVSSAQYNVAIGYSAFTDSTSGKYNVLIGAVAGTSLTTGDDNVAIGTNAFKDSIVNKYTVSIGTQALENITDDANDGSIAIGYKAASGKVGSGDQYTTASVHIGFQSAVTQTTGANNTSVGHATMGGNASGTALTGSNNTVMGYSAGYAMQGTSQNNTIIGASAGDAITDTADTVLIGYDAGGAINHANGQGQVFIGAQAGHEITQGAHNVAIGYLALSSADNVESHNTAIGAGSMQNVDNDSSNHNVALGKSSLIGGSGALTNNVAIGSNALNSTGSYDITGAVAIGYDALTALTSGSGNTAIGYNSLKEVTTGSNLTVLGYQAGESITDNGHSVIIGQGAGRDGNVASYSVLVGNFAGYKSTGDITAVGSSAGSNLTTGIRNTYFGSSSGFGNHTGSYNTYVGWRSGYGVADNANNSNTAVGYATLTSITTGSNNVAIGKNSLPASTTAGNNVAIGINSMLNITTGQRNVAVGSFSMAMNNDGNPRESVDNVFIGYNSGGGTWANVASNQNTAVGANTMDAACNDVDDNVAFGFSALSALTTGSDNVAVGSGSLVLNTTGHSNVAIGKGAGAAIVDATFNTAVGFKAGDGTVDGGRNVSLGAHAHGNADTGDKNIAIGYQAGNVITGSNNITIGNQSGDSITSGNHNTLIGDESDVDTATDSYQVKIGSYGIIKFKTARVTLNSYSAGFSADNRAVTPNGVFTIPRYSHISKIWVKVVTLSAGTALYSIFVGTADDETAGEVIAGGVEILGANCDSGCITRCEGTETANSDIVASSGGVVGRTWISSINVETDNSPGWMSAATNAIYVACAGTGNNQTDPGADAVLDIGVEYY